MVIESIETFGEIKARHQSEGFNISDLDLVIASTALTMNFILVTNNERHFSKIPGLIIDNWAKS